MMMGGQLRGGGGDLTNSGSGLWRGVGGGVSVVVVVVGGI